MDIDYVIINEYIKAYPHLFLILQKYNLLQTD